MYFRVSQAPSRYYGLVCAMCSQDLLQQLEVLLMSTYSASSRCQAMYFERMIHKVALEFPDIIEGLVAVQLCVLFLLLICLTDGTTFS